MADSSELLELSDEVSELDDDELLFDCEDDDLDLEPELLLLLLLLPFLPFLPFRLKKESYDLFSFLQNISHSDLRMILLICPPWLDQATQYPQAVSWGSGSNCWDPTGSMVVMYSSLLLLELELEHDPDFEQDSELSSLDEENEFPYVKWWRIYVIRRIHLAEKSTFWKKEKKSKQCVKSTVFPT